MNAKARRARRREGLICAALVLLVAVGCDQRHVPKSSVESARSNPAAQAIVNDGATAVATDSTATTLQPGEKSSDTFRFPDPSFVVVRDLRIDGSAAEHPLTQVGGLRIDSRGNIYVEQGTDNRFSVFERGARWLRNVGREGSGPGEFRMLSSSRIPALFGLKSDSLWAVDVPTGRLALFDTVGKFVRALDGKVRIPGGAYLAAGPLAYLSNGMLLARVEAVAQEGFSDGTRLPDLVVRATDAGQVIDTAFALQMPWITFARAENTTYQPQEAIKVGPYLVVAADGSEFVVVDRHDPTAPGLARFRILRFAAASGPPFEKEFTYYPRAVTQKLIDSLRPPADPSAHRTAQAMARLKRDFDRFPRYVPPINRTLVGRDGTLWLGNDWDENRRRWMILDRRSAVVGTVDMPLGFRLLQADLQSVWGTETDSLGVQSVIRYRLTPKPRT